jgi:hypothetical protein
MMTARQVLISVRLSDDEKADLDARASRLGMRRAELVRALIAEPERRLAADVAWLAYHEDMSEVRVFGSEVAALRYAIEHGMQAVRVVLGHSLQETLAAMRDARDR